MQWSLAACALLLQEGESNAWRYWMTFWWAAKQAVLPSVFYFHFVKSVDNVSRKAFKTSCLEKGTQVP